MIAVFASRWLCRALWAGPLLVVVPVVGHAQEPVSPGGVTVSGTVVAGSSSGPTPNAVVSIPARSRSVLTADDGRFALEGVPEGTQLFRVEQLGYEALEMPVEVYRGMGPLVFELKPDPLELEALSVEVDGALTLTGRVVDARSRAAMPGVWVWLPRDETGVRSDSSGIFRLPRVATGPQLIQVEHVGYGLRYLPVLALPPWTPIEIELEPDDAVLEGLPTVERELRIRRNRYLGVVAHYDAERLTSYGVDDIWKVVQSFSRANVVACRGTHASRPGGLPPGAWCLQAGDKIVSPVVCVDGRLRLGGLDALQQYRPHEFASLEVFGNLGMIIRGYTHRYVEALARLEERTAVNGEPGAGASTGLGWETRSGLENPLGETGSDVSVPTGEPGIGLVYEGAPC